MNQQQMQVLESRGLSQAATVLQDIEMALQLVASQAVDADYRAAFELMEHVITQARSAKISFLTAHREQQNRARMFLPPMTV